MSEVGRLFEWVASWLSADEWQAVGAIGTLAVAVAAAIFALFQVREAARLRRDQARPYVVVYVDRVAATIVDLVVKNFGATAARQVTLEWDRTVLMYSTGKEPVPLDLIEHIPLLAPDQEWRTLWDFQGRRIAAMEAPYRVKLSSRDSRGRKLPDEEFSIDTRQFANAMIRQQNGLHEIGEALAKIEHQIGTLSDTSPGLCDRDGAVRVEQLRSGSRLDDVL